MLIFLAGLLTKAALISRMTELLCSLYELIILVVTKQSDDDLRLFAIEYRQITD